MTCTGMFLARAAFVAAASTPLALPVMMEERGGSELTYAVTRSGSENRLLPTIANFSVYPAVAAFLPMEWMFSSNRRRSLMACRS